MNTTAIVYKLALSFHFIGFVMLVGIFLADFAAYNQFWKLAVNNWQQAKQLKQITSRFPALIAIGSVFLLCGGITMITLIMKAGPVTPQLWFQIKMLLVIVIIVNAIFVGARASRKIQRIISKPLTNSEINKLTALKRQLTFFHISQLIMFLTIFILSAFRFQ